MSTPARTPWEQPFASTSPWNIGIGTNAQWESSSNAAVQTLDSLSGEINVTSWSMPIYVGTASDPEVTITDASGVVPPQTLHVPLDAVPAAGSDGNMSFFDETQPDKVWSYWDVTFNNGTDPSGGLTAGLGSVFDSTGDGFSAPSYSPNQSDNNYVGGVITPYDLDNGSIDHMLRVAISRNALEMPNGSNYYTSNIPWPDDHVDFDGPSTYTGDIPAGSTFGIPASVNLSSLGLSQGGMMLATALQDYGAIWKDSGGSNQITFYGEPSDNGNPLMGEMQSDLSKIIPYLSIMTNQGPESVNGGGSYPYEASPLTIPGNDSSSTDTSSSGSTGQSSTTASDTSGNSGNTTSASSTSTSQQSVVNLTDSNSSVTDDNVAVNGTGSYSLDLEGNGDTVNLSGGAEQVSVYGSNNNVTTGDGNDTISIFSTGNTINAGAGNNSITDSGSDNTLVLPAAGSGYDDIFGNVLQNGDLLDFRPMLAGTNWNGDTSTLGQYVQVSTSSNGQDAIISVSQSANGSGTAVATLHGAGSLSLAALEANALTS